MADVPSISILTDAYESVQEYIAEETTEGDSADVAKAQGVLSTLEELIASEASEPSDSTPVEAVEED